MIRVEGLLELRVARPAPLTRRESQVAQGIREGLSTKEIAWRLGMATKTAEVHRYNLMRKLGAHNVAQVIRQLAAA